MMSLGEDTRNCVGAILANQIIVCTMACAALVGSSFSRVFRPVLMGISICSLASFVLDTSPMPRGACTTDWDDDAFSAVLWVAYATLSVCLVGMSSHRALGDA